MNITVPDELQHQMDALKAMDWSTVACKAFAEVVAQQTATDKVNDTNDVIERLKASKHQHQSESEKTGLTAGQTWATKHADAAQLQRLSKAKDPMNDWCFGMGSSAYSSGERLFFLIEPQRDGDRARASEFWKGIWSDGSNGIMGDDAFVHAFAKGAMAVWDEVKGKI